MLCYWAKSKRFVHIFAICYPSIYWILLQHLMLIWVHNRSPVWIQYPRTGGRCQVGDGGLTSTQPSPPLIISVLRLHSILLCHAPLSYFTFSYAKARTSGSIKLLALYRAVCNVASHQSQFPCLPYDLIKQVWTFRHIKPSLFDQTPTLFLYWIHHSWTNGEDQKVALLRSNAKYLNGNFLSWEYLCPFMLLAGGQAG